MGAYVLLTDGVVEGPSYPIEEGLKQVVGLVNGAVRTDPDELAAQVIKVADLTGHSDDAAVLVLRYGGLRDERCSGGSQDKRQGERSSRHAWQVQPVRHFTPV